MTKKQETKQQEILAMAHHDYEKGLNSHAFFKLSNHATGVDLVQDTFLKTWAYLVKGGKIQTMKAFLYHILNNLIIDEYRKRKHQETSLDVMLEKGFDEPLAEDSERLLTFLDGKKAILLIANLPEVYQKIMRMKYVQGLTLTEMALITGKSKNSVAVKVHRGLEKLTVLYNTKALPIVTGNI